MASAIGSLVLLEKSGMTMRQAGLWIAASSAVGVIGLIIISSLATSGRRSVIPAILLFSTAVSTIGLAQMDGPPMPGALMMLGVTRSPSVPLLTLLLMGTEGVGPVRIRIVIATGLFFTVAEIGGFGL